MAGALLSEVGERIDEELDYEIEAQHQRRVWRLSRDHPHVLVPRVYTDLCTRRVLVTEYVDGLGFDEIAQLDEPERDRIGEIVFRFFFGLVWRERIVLGDPHPDNCLLCPDGRVCLLDYALLRGLEPDYLDGERDVMRAVIDADPHAVHRALGGPRVSHLHRVLGRRRTSRVPGHRGRVASRRRVPKDRPGVCRPRAGVWANWAPLATGR
jgi:predicted unusual protein kinase regulating ubiquinone biosynthesis (AarF/ABC1/UbiB family)